MHSCSVLTRFATLYRTSSLSSPPTTSSSVESRPGGTCESAPASLNAGTVRMLTARGNVHSPEAAHPYYVFRDAGYTVTFASPAGGKAPLDQSSVEMFKEDKQCQEFLNSQETQDLVNNTHKVSTMHRRGARGRARLACFGDCRTKNKLTLSSFSGRSSPPIVPLQLSDMDVSKFDTVYYVGGHGPIFGRSISMFLRSFRRRQ